MDLFHVTDHELQVLMGLLKLIVHADQEVSVQEQGMLEELQSEVGPARWNDAVHTARTAYTTVADIEVDARRIHRPHVQQLIHDVLIDLADADEMIEAEAAVLRWVVAEWGVQSDVEPVPEEDYVLLDTEED